MIEKSRFKALSNLAWPITGAMVAGNLLTLIDTAMVSRLGPVSMAGVAMSATVSALLMASVTGLAPAVQAITSRRVGEGNHDRTANGLHAGLLLGVLIGLVAGATAIYFAEQVFTLLKLEAGVHKLAVSYFKVVALALPAIGANMAYRGFYNGIGRTKIFMVVLIINVVINIFLNWVLIYGNLGMPRLDALGAGIASSISLVMSTVLYTMFAFKMGRPYGFAAHMPSGEVIKGVLRLAIPGSIHQFLASIISMVFFVIVSKIGTVQLAAITVVFRLSMVVIMPAFGFAMAGATMVGQALGRGEPDDARNWGWDTMKAASLIMAIVGFPMAFMPRFVLGVFITDLATLEMAVFPLTIAGLSLAVNGCSLVLVQALNGAGDQKYVLMATQAYHWFIGTPLIGYVALVLHGSLNVIWVVFVSNYLVIVVILVRRWRGTRWTQRSV